MMSDEELREQEAAFQRSLDAFEQCVDTPFVPGELRPWIEAVCEAFEELALLLQQQTQQVHSAEFRDIAREDPGLLQRVEQMREADREIAEQRRNLAQAISGLKTHVASVGADEAAIREELNRFVERAQQFVARVRKQEMTVRTWWVEAFHRDRGTVD